MGARERAVRGRCSGERHGVDEIEYGGLRREPHEKARERERPRDMGEDGLGSEDGRGRAEHLLREEGGGSNDWKRSAKYARGLRESGSVGEAGVMLLGFRIRNEFRERLVTGLKKRGYNVKKAGW